MVRSRVLTALPCHCFPSNNPPSTPYPVHSDPQCIKAGGVTVLVSAAVGGVEFRLPIWQLPPSECDAPRFRSTPCRPSQALRGARAAFETLNLSLCSREINHGRCRSQCCRAEQGKSQSHSSFSVSHPCAATPRHALRLMAVCCWWAAVFPGRPGRGGPFTAPRDDAARGRSFYRGNLVNYCG